MLTYSLNGLLILLIGMIGGFYQSRSIKSNNGKEVAWRVVHSGGCMAGIMMIALGLIIERLNWIRSENIIYSTCLLIGTYSLITGMVVAAVTGARGIDIESRLGKSGKLVSMLYKTGAIFSILAIIYLLIKVMVNII